MTVNIAEYSTLEERQVLIEAFEKAGSEGVYKALEKLAKVLGRDDLDWGFDQNPTGFEGKYTPETMEWLKAERCPDTHGSQGA